MHFNRILVAIDGSVHSQLALEMATSMAQRDVAELVLASVAANASATAGQWPMSPVPNILDIQEGIDDAVHTLLHKTLYTLPGDVQALTAFKCGKPGPQLIECVEQYGCDAICIGARGRGKVGSLAGSVSQYVLHHASVAVFVAHAAGSQTGQI